MSIRAVIMDIGGVLVRTTNVGLLARWERQFGLPEGALRDTLFASEVSRRATIGEATTEDVWAYVATRFGLTADEQRAFIHDFGAAETLDGDLAEFVRGLRPRNQTALLSNAWIDGREFFSMRYGLDTLTDLMVISAEEGVAKPDPEIYRVTAERLGVPPEACVFVDDLAANVAGARTAGMAAIRFESTPQIEVALRAMLGA